MPPKNRKVKRMFAVPIRLTPSAIRPRRFRGRPAVVSSHVMPMRRNIRREPKLTV